MGTKPARCSLAVAVLALALAGCSGDGYGDDDGGSTATAVPRPTSTVIAPAPSPDPGDPTTTSTVEVQGIVGVVVVQTRIIEIRPTGPEQRYTKIALPPNATIMRAGGGDELVIEDVRPSDRIVAFGRPGDDPGTLTADDVTVQQVVPGSAPGGG